MAFSVNVQLKLEVFCGYENGKPKNRLIFLIKLETTCTVLTTVRNKSAIKSTVPSFPIP